MELLIITVYEKLEDTKGIIKSRTDNTRTNWTNNDLQNTTQKRLSNTNTTKNRRWTQVLRKGKQFLLHVWHPSCYSCYAPSNMSWISKGPDCDYGKRNAWELFWSFWNNLFHQVPQCLSVICGMSLVFPDYSVCFTAPKKKLIRTTYCWTKYMLENTKGAIKNGQSRETGNIENNEEKHKTLCSNKHK